MKISYPVINNCCNKFHSLNHIKPRWWKRRLMLMEDYHCAAAVAATTTTNTTVPSASSRRQQSQQHRRRDKIVVIMGATGSGKSRLSVNLATRFPSSEIINSDKMQVYRGLDITTNKIPFHERLGFPHHLLGEFDSSLGDLTPSQYRSHASSVISQIVSRRKLPFLVGGSNSFIYALLADSFHPDSDVFSGSDSLCAELRYSCCFLWVDVSLPVLNEYLEKRVDDMLDSGMQDELAQYYESEINESKPNAGLRKAIGVPEFERYFRMFPGPVKRVNDTRRGGNPEMDEEEKNNQVRRVVCEKAVRQIKENTCQLAKRQIEKILRLKNGGGWDLRRLEATEAFRAVLEGSDGWSEIWERQVVEPSVKIVKRFLEE
ncbi:hypothetical protein Ancab_021068 [Ancistrocladus abbreviatus]